MSPSSDTPRLSARQERITALTNSIVAMSSCIIVLTNTIKVLTDNILLQTNEDHEGGVVRREQPEHDRCLYRSKQRVVCEAYHGEEQKGKYLR